MDTFRFLSKPIDSEKFEAYFRNAVEKIQLQQEELFFSYSYDRQFFKVLLSDIVYFESQKRSIRLYKKDGTEGSFYDWIYRSEPHWDDLYEIPLPGTNRPAAPSRYPDIKDQIPPLF